MAAPVWTTREWRPLARDLCAHVLDGRTEIAEDASARAEQRLLLRADKVVAKLYAHKYMDTTPQQVKGEVEEIAKKMEIHLLNRRAARLRELSRDCDYRVVTMLLELADAPTRASDERVAVDEAAPLEALRAWNRLLAPGSSAERTESKAREEAALAAELEAELLQVAWEDDWWKERQDDGASELDDALDMESEDFSEEDGDDYAARGIASRVLGSEPSEVEPLTDVDVEMQGSDVNGDGDGSTDGYIDEEDEEDEQLLQYFRPAPAPVVNPQAMDMKEDWVRTETHLPSDLSFSFEKPSRLLRLVESVNARRRQGVQGSVRSSTQDDHPRRVVHERVLVQAVFYAFHGLQSPFFELQLEQTTFFNGDFRPSQFVVSTLVQRGLAVAHLSPTTLSSVLEKLIDAASDLQFLRELAYFLRSTSRGSSQSTTAEGLASEIQRHVLKCDKYIEDIHQSMNEAAERPQLRCDELPNQKLLPTLLSTDGHFQEIFSMLSQIRSILTNCFVSFCSQNRDDINVAHLSSTILTSLHHDLQIVSIESMQSHCLGQEQTLNVYAILSAMFAGALAPYLEALDKTLFRRGYDARIVLHRELFFTFISDSMTPPLSPRSGTRRLGDESFEDAISALTPFQVDDRAVPSFLNSIVKLMSSALESRQIMNQYLSQHVEFRSSDPVPPRLIDVFLANFSISKPPQFEGERSISDTTPLGEGIRRAVIHPIETKCSGINGSIAELFREQLHFREHVHVLRLFVLMQQQDVFTQLVQYLIDQIRLDPIGWAKSEIINLAFQDAIQRLHTEGLITTDQRNIAARLTIRVDTKELSNLRTSRHINITSIRYLQFRFGVTPPLRVLFSGSIVSKYSKLAALLLQVKIVEISLTNFKQSYRHRLCFMQTQDPLRGQLVYLADMLQYTRAVLNYLANQMTGDAWGRVEHIFAHSQSIRDINVAHDEYLDKMLNSFFVLKKHEGFTRQFMKNFNDILSYGNRVDEFVRTVESNMGRFFDTVDANATKTSGTRPARGGILARGRDLVANGEFRDIHAKLLHQLKNPEGNYENQLQVITIVLDAMVKNGASPHVNELLLLLTFNGYRSPTTSR